MKLPKCCIGCKYIDYEIEDYKPPVYYCWLNVFLPFKKEKCKRRKVAI